MKFASLQSELDRLPPCLCRLFARRRTLKQGWIPKSHREIAGESNLAPSTVADLSRKKSWANVPIEIADRFARACGVNLANVGEAVKRLRLSRTRLRHLGRGNAQQRRMITNLLNQAKP